MESPNLPLGWRPTFDGIRGIAVVSVVLFHFKTRPLLDGGWVGVDLFFALSGFLITSLLLEEWWASGSISLPRFYVRRFLRLFPAFCAFVAVVVAVRLVYRDAWFTGHPTVHDTLENAAFGFSYAYNWALAFDLVDPVSFGHLWSLAVEEQYYLLWPGLLVILLRLGLSLRGLVLVTALLAVASASVPMLLDDPSWRRVYYGSDYRVHGLLIGSITGMLFSGGVVRREHIGHPIFRAMLAVAVAYIGALMLFSTTKPAFLFLWGIPALGVAGSLVVLACAFADGGWPVRVLGNRVVTYLGQRSYAIYLWHLPIGQWFRYLDAPQQLLVAGAVTLLAAELSHRLVERPALSLKGRFGRGRARAPAVAPAVMAPPVIEAARGEAAA